MFAFVLGLVLAKLTDLLLLLPLAMWLWQVRNRNIWLQLIGAIAIAVAYSAFGIAFGFTAPTRPGVSVIAAIVAALAVAFLARFAFAVAPTVIEWFCRTPLRRRIGIGLLAMVGMTAVIAPGAVMATIAQQKSGMSAQFE
jgi:hypothetical protein